jgi:hypothetical protein
VYVSFQSINFYSIINSHSITHFSFVRFETLFLRVGFFFFFFFSRHNNEKDAAGENSAIKLFDRKGYHSLHGIDAELIAKHYHKSLKQVQREKSTLISSYIPLSIA